MTPAARYAAAIEIIDEILAGKAAEQCLIRWARSHRFAGSGDRAAIRDIVFEAERKRRSAAFVGGEMSGRGIVLGLLVLSEIDPAKIFTGEKYAPCVLQTEELARFRSIGESEPAVRSDLPDWIHSELTNSHGDAAEEIAANLRDRAPVFLRVNVKNGSREDAVKALELNDILVSDAKKSSVGLEVLENPRRISQSNAFLEGLVELQDASSQAAILSLADISAKTVLDYCAGGGGKSLALADLTNAKIFAHDIDPKRMGEIIPRAERAGVSIDVITTEELSNSDLFDLVLVDAPCSGSGAWRRSPSGKWSLTQSDLVNLRAVQSDILDKSVRYVAPNGTLAYATCSVFKNENQLQISGFLKRHPQWRQVQEHVFLPGPNGDGFYISTLKRNLS